MGEGIGKTVVLGREGDRDFFSDLCQDFIDGIFLRMGIHMKEHIEEGKFDLTNVCHAGAVVFSGNQFVEKFARHCFARLDMVRNGLHHVPVQNEVLHELARLEQYPNLVVLGDFNIAPEDRDVWDPESWAESVLCTPKAREAFQRLIDLGLTDSFRAFEQPEKSYSWWDYRMMAFRRNRGLRIDHILISKALVSKNLGVEIHKKVRGNERPSDHAPVTLTLDL